MYIKKNLRLFGFIWFIVLLSLTNSQAKKKKNILWIYLEDVSGCFGCYGESLIKTPNVDGLSDSGIRFDRFYTPAGACSATRSAIITGMMQTTIGARHHRSCRATFRGKNGGIL